MGYAYTYTCDCKKKAKKRFLQFFCKKNQYMNENEYDCEEFVIWQGRGMMSGHSKKYYQEAAAGQYGKQWQELAEKYPEGKFECQKEVYKCPQCGYWDSYDRKTFYAVNYTEGYGIFSGLKFGGGPENKVMIGELPQICPQCNHLMGVVNIWKEPLICGKCCKKNKNRF